MQPLHPPTRHFRAALWVLCAAALLLQLGLHSGALQDGWSHAQLDWLIRQRAQRQTANPNLVIIDIDDTSLQVLSEEAGKWPWPRSLHAELLEYLLPQQPKAVVFDLLFSEPDRYRPDADAYLAEVLGQSERVYLAALEQQPAEQSLAPLLSSYPAQTGLTRGAQADPEQRGLLLLPQALPPALWRLGSINFRADPDGVGRRYELYRSFGDWRLPSLPARVARDLGATLPEGSSFLLDWPSASRLPYPRITYAAALAQARGQVQTVAADYYADKVVLIGTTASGLHDLRRTPLDELYPAVFILGTALDNLLRGQHLRQLPALPTGLLGLPVLLGLAALLLHEKLLGALLLSLAGSLLLLVGSYALVLHGWLLSTVPTLLSLWLLLGLAQVLFYWRRRQQLQNTIGLFSRFLDPVVVAQLVALEDPRALLESRECQITVLFSDIRNFTTLSERHSAPQIMQLLEHYFSQQVEVLFNYRATLDKFIGDAVMAFWGAPLANPHQAADAIQAALEMLENVERFRQEFGHPDFDIGIGIHTGSAVVGMVGASQRYDYTAIGDTVNLASRIEGLTKGRARLLVSAATMQACAERFDFVAHGDFQVKGRNEAVTLFEPKRKTS